jgi:peptidoglycan/xylan/chitin deacetylase (PgdA/CDA1 family)
MAPSPVGARSVRRWAATAVVIGVAVLVAGCGIKPGTRTAAGTPADPYVNPDGKFVAAPVSAQPLVLAPGQTVVSISFDDGRASQVKGAAMMKAHGLPGTFYVNSGTIGMPEHLTLLDLERIATLGDEIGGHSLTHPMLLNLPPDELAREICEDRKTLLGWGFAVRSFAYPFDAVSPGVVDTVRGCRYNSARSLGDVGFPNSCGAWCVPAENVPPGNPMRTKAPSQVDTTTTPADLERLIANAQSAGGGWVQLTFHDVCAAECPSSAIGLSEPRFEEFLTWLANQRDQGSVLVRTVGDIIGGAVQPAVGGPAAPPAPVGKNGVKNPGLQEQADGIPVCWMRGGYGTNSPEFSLVPGPHSGTTASRLVMRNYVDGDAELQQTTDLGTCAPTVEPGRTYTIEARYTSTVPTSFSVQYRLARGIWVFGVSSPIFPPAAQFTAAHWKLPPIPNGVTGVSCGLALAENGELVTGDYSLVADAKNTR